MPPSPKRIKVGAETPADAAVRILGSEVVPPAPPAEPSADELRTSAAATVKEFCELLVPHTKFNLARLLVEPASQGVMDLRVPLADLLPGRIKRGAGESDSFKETFDIENCHSSLEKHLLYESANSGFAFDLVNFPVVGSKPLVVQETWEQLNEALKVYDVEHWNASSEEPAKRRFIIPGYFTTSLPDLSIVEARTSSICPLSSISWWRGT